MVSDVRGAPDESLRLLDDTIGRCLLEHPNERVLVEHARQHREFTWRRSPIVVSWPGLFPNDRQFRKLQACKGEGIVASKEPRERVIGV